VLAWSGAGLLLAACSSSSHPSQPIVIDDAAAEGATDATSEVARDGDVGAEDGDAFETSPDAPDAVADTKSDVIPEASPQPPICAQGHVWKAWTTGITDPIARFGGVSADGLTISWTRFTGEIMLGSRDVMSGSFDTVQNAPPAAHQNDARYALDSSGTRLIVVDDTGTRLAFWTGLAGGGSWSLDKTVPAEFKLMLSTLQSAKAVLSEPAFSASGTSLLLLVSTGGGAPQLYESRWNAMSKTWGVAAPISATELASTDDTHRRRPTGMSADDLTLFFYDEIKGVERGAWRASPTDPFTHFEDLAGFAEASPNAGCSALYYRGVVGSNPAILLAQ
jgi:hypothetical protein